MWGLVLDVWLDFASLIEQGCASITSGSSHAARFRFAPSPLCTFALGSIIPRQVLNASLTGCASITSGSSHAARFRFAPSRSVYFRTRLDNTSPSAQCIAHGLRLDYVRLQPCSSIPLRSISLTGCALCKKKEKVPHSCKHDVAPSLSFCAWLEPSLQICSNTLVRKGILRSGVR